jgi:hypothetical protein
MANLLSLEDTKDVYNLYYYGVKPSWALAVVTTFLFTCVTLVHLILLFYKRSWFLIPLIIGALCMSQSLKHAHKSTPASVPVILNHC